MAGIENENIRTLLKQAYQTNMANDCYVEREEEIAAFEKKYAVEVPGEYRWLMLNFGIANFGDPFLYTVKDLHIEYPAFIENYEQYKEDYTMPELDPFPIGGFGDGSIAILDRNTGKIWMLVHDAAEEVPLEKVAKSFIELLKMFAESALWVDEEIRKNSLHTN